MFRASTVGAQATQEHDAPSLGDGTLPAASAPSTTVAELGVDALSLDQLSLVDLFRVDTQFTTATRAVTVDTDWAPAIVSVVTREQIRRFGYRTVPEALASVPGMFVANDLTTHNLAVRGIHGGPESWSRIVKVMIDGVPVQYMPNGGALLGPEFVPIALVERIEIVRGPASALYGANAFLGVVNVITRRPTRRTMEGGAEAEAIAIRDNLGAGVGASALLHSGGRRPVWSSFGVALLSIDRSGLGPAPGSPRASAFDGVESQGDVTTPFTLAARAGWDGAAFGDVVVQANVQRLLAHSQFVGPSVLEPGAVTAMMNTVVRLDYRLPLLDDWRWGANKRQQISLHGWAGVARARTLDAERFVAGSTEVHRQRSTDTIESGAELTYTLGRHALTAGVDGQWIDAPGEVVFDQGPGGSRMARNVPNPAMIDNVGAFAQLIVVPWEPLGITGSVRHDRGDLVDQATTYRVSTVLRVTDGVLVKAVAGTSFVPPALSQLEAIPLALGGVTGNPDLRSQQGQTAEVALLLRPTSELRFDLTGFRTAIADRVEDVPDGTLLSATNLTDSLSLGVELEGAYSRPSCSVEGSVSYQHTTLETPANPSYYWNLIYEGDPTPTTTPTWIAQLRASARIPGTWLEAALSGLYVGSRKSTEANILLLRERYRLPATFVLGVHATTRDLQLWDERATQISLHVEDLLGTGYRQGGELGVDVPAVGRSIYLRLTQEL